MKIKFFSHSQHGDIFIAPKRQRGLRWLMGAYKFLPSWKTVGLIGTSAVLFFTLGTLFQQPESSQKQYATPLIEKYDQNTQNNSSHHPNDDYNGYYYDNATPLPDIKYIETNPTYPDYSRTPTPNTTDLNGTSQQIIATQQQMTQIMQSCSQNARQLQSQILNMRRQQDALYKQKDNLWNRVWQIDGSTPEGERQRQSIEKQAQQIEKQAQNYDENIRRAEEQFNANKDRCWQTVDQLNQRREELEGRLHEQFGQNLDLQLWLN